MGRTLAAARRCQFPSSELGQVEDTVENMWKRMRRAKKKERESKENKRDIVYASRVFTTLYTHTQRVRNWM